MPQPNYYMNIALAVAKNAKCLRRKFGAIIVKDDVIISTGYNGAPRGMEDCLQIGSCLRDTQNIPHGSNYEICRSVHAEQNAVIHATYADMYGADIYVGGFNDVGSLVSYARPCLICSRLLINARLARVFFLVRDECVDPNVTVWPQKIDDLSLAFVKVKDLSIIKTYC